MRVLHVTPAYIPAYRYGGPVKSTHELSRALVRKGVDVAVYTTNADWETNLKVPVNKQVEIEGVKVTYFSLGFPRFYYYSAGLGRALRANLKKFDLIHIHSVFLYPTFIAARLCREYGIPYIIDPCGALNPDEIKIRSFLKKSLYIKVIEEKNINYAAAIQLASVYEKQQFLCLGIKTNKAIVISRGIEVAEYINPGVSRSLQNKYRQLEGAKVVLFLGRLSLEKGLELLVLAMKKVFAKRNDVYLIIAGSDERGYGRKLKLFCSACGVNDRVIFTGMLLGEDKIAALYSSDVFALSSPGESFGMVVLEAMACRRPVVITDRVGICPEVKEYKAGIVTEYDPDAFSQAVLKLLDDEDLRKKCGENARLLAQDKFGWDKIADEAIREYKNILAR